MSGGGRAQTKGGAAVSQDPGRRRAGRPKTSPAIAYGQSIRAAEEGRCYLTETEAAELAGVDIRTITNWESRPPWVYPGRDDAGAFCAWVEAERRAGGVRAWNRLADRAAKMAASRLVEIRERRKNAQNRTGAGQ